MLFKDGDKILFTGDSITDAGRKRPVGEGLGEGVGTGYVRAIDNILTAVYPDYRLHIMNTGISGNTSRDLIARVEGDVISLGADYVVFMIGANDVWRQVDEPTNSKAHVYLPEYSQNVAAFVDRVQASGAKVICMLPYYMEPNKTDLMRVKIEECAAAARRICEAKGVMCIDTQGAFDEFMKHRYPAQLSWDRVHPGPVGSVVLARTFLRAVEMDRAFI